MFFKFVILFFLVIFTSAAQERTKKQKRGTNGNEVRLSFKSIAENSQYSNLTRHSRAEKSELVKEERTHRGANPSAGKVTILHAAPANPKDSDKRAKWQGWQRCPRGFRVRAYRLRQESDAFDDQGLTKIDFKCVKPEDGKRARWIESGRAYHRDLEWEPVTCPHAQQFVTGIQGVFGGPHYGALKINVVCDVPSCARFRYGKKPRRFLVGDHEVPIHHVYSQRERGPELRCPAGAVVCGLNTKFQKRNPWTAPFTDDTGINEIKVMCCPFHDKTLP